MIKVFVKICNIKKKHPTNELDFAYPLGVLSCLFNYNKRRALEFWNCKVDIFSVICEINRLH